MSELVLIFAAKHVFIVNISHMYTGMRIFMRVYVCGRVCIFDESSPTICCSLRFTGSFSESCQGRVWGTTVKDCSIMVAVSIVLHRDDEVFSRYLAFNAVIKGQLLFGTFHDMLEPLKRTLRRYNRLATSTSACMP